MFRRLALTAVLTLAPLPLSAGDVLVFAAASLKTALDEVAATWSDATGHNVRISYAGSGQLAQQIRLGAPAELFVSANPGWMDAVEEDGLVARRVDLLGNQLVLVAADGRAALVIGPDMDLVSALDGGKLAMALVEAVPVGQYGKAALESLGLWQDLAPHVAQTDNARAALALVAAGAAPLGIVYATDALAEPRVTVIGNFAPDTHPPIVYPAALLSGADGDAAGLFDALVAAQAAAVFTRHGFTKVE